MVAPALLFTLVLGIYPMIASLWISFLDYDLLSVANEGSSFVGLRNYVTLFGDPRFLQTLVNTVVFTLLAVAISILLGVILSQAANAPMPGRSILRTVLCLPWLVPPAVAAAIWMWLFQTERSPINAVARDAGLIGNNIGFLTDSGTWGPFSIPMMSVIAVRVWNGLPFVIIFLLAALQSIPKDHYEAAQIDGANAWSRFRHVTLPALGPVLAVLVALLFMTGFGHFEINYVMTGGGPQNLTNVLAVFSYQQAFSFFRFDYGAAASGVILVLTSLVCVFYIRAQIRSDND
jgi:ABC-type sugar transport system permease subunit